MILPRKTIEDLRDKATKGPWTTLRSTDGLLLYSNTDYPIGGTDICNLSKVCSGDATFIAALPDITETCLNAMKRVERLEIELDAEKTSRGIDQTHN